MNRLLRLSFLLGLALLAPIVPFLLVGEHIEARVQGWIDSGPSSLAVGAMTIGVLSTDVLLPVPSSVVNTWAGAQLGVIPGTICAWAGMTIGGVVGFALASWIGPAIVERITHYDDRARLEVLSERHGWLLLIATRPLPVLAEATVLILGSVGMRGRQFLPAILMSNLGLAAAYATLGAAARSSGQLALVLLLSVVVPILATVAARLALSRRFAERPPSGEF
jgi:uncharacterized membrane protein YdjX (TVP38/TMEM64 family)